ncbi:MAG: hypothetical protein ACTSQG_10315 [Promethearchaeota archaeon]
MVNTYRKGLRLERKVKEYLESLGFLVARVESINKYKKTKDLFNLFDLIAINKYIIKFIQVTSTKPHPHKKYIDFYKKYKSALIYQFVYKKNNVFDVYFYNSKGYIKYQVDLKNRKT